MNVGAMAAVLVLTVALFAPAHAKAQDDAALLRDGLFARDRNISVAERPKPEYAPLPLRVGAFVVSPEVTSSLAYDDNIFVSGINRISDAVVDIAPAVSLTSDWTRNQISGFARAAQSLYLAHSGEDTTDYAAGLAGRLDVRRDFGLAGGLDDERDTEPRTSEASPALAIRPVQYDLESVWIEGAKTFDRLRLTGRGSIRDYAYDDAEAAGGTSIYQRDQDRTESGAAGLAEYAYSPELSLLAELTGNQRQYRDAAAGEPLRTSSGYEATIGANFDLSHLARGEIRIGYLDQAYDNRAFRSVGGFALRGKIEYFPSTLTTITATASRGVQDSGIPGVAGFVANEGGGRIDHELLRNLVLSARLAYAENKYLNYARHDEIQTSQASAAYLVNRALSLTLSYARLNHRSQGVDAGPAYAIDRVAVAITCRV